MPILRAVRMIRQAISPRLAKAARDGVTLDRRHDHLGRIVQRFEEGAELTIPDRDRVLLARLRLVGEALLHVLEIGAGAEGAACATQDHDLDVAAVLQDFENRLQLANQRRIQCVLHLRPVQRHVKTRPLATQDQGFVLFCKLGHENSGAQRFSRRGRVPMCLQMICSITSSAPPPIEARRESRKARATGLSHEVAHAAPVLQAAVGDLAHHAPGLQLGHRGQHRDVFAVEILLAAR
jgi:hypothetical protein